MGLISNRLYQYWGRRRFIGIGPRELSEFWSPWMPSGKDVNKLENSPLGLLRLYNRVGYRTLKSATIWDSDTTGTSAGLITWTGLPHLQ